jgi:hypothetical protein
MLQLSDNVVTTRGFNSSALSRLGPASNQGNVIVTLPSLVCLFCLRSCRAVNYGIEQERTI